MQKHEKSMFKNYSNFAPFFVILVNLAEIT